MIRYIRSSLVGLLAAIVLVATSPASAQQSPFAGLGGLSDSFEQLVDKVGVAVVQVRVSGYAPHRGGGETGFVRPSQSGGSGVIVDPSGYIMTNAHVVAGARRITVQLAFKDSTTSPQRSVLKAAGQILGAQLVGLDTETDLALLKVPATDLPYLSFGDSEELRQGQLVFAFGSPLGLDNSVSMGVISAVARQLSDEDPMIYIQTDASINPGNSGGPLVNAQGELVGINTFIFSMSGGNEGLGFSAPSNIAKTVFRQLRDAGFVRRGVIGVHAQTITPLMAQVLDLPKAWGVVLGDVYPGSPASKVGLQVGDVVITMNGKVMENARQFDVNLYQRNVGETVKLVIKRDGVRKTVQVPVIERENDPDRFASMVSPEKNLVSRLGILGIELTRDLVESLDGLRKPSGVIVAARSLSSPAVGAPLYPGDIIHACNGVEIGTLEKLRNLTDTLSLGDPVVLQIERRGRLRFLAFEIQ